MEISQENLAKLRNTFPPGIRVELIRMDLPIIPYDEEHIKIGDYVMHCTGPLMHVESTGKIQNFALMKEFYYEPRFHYYVVAGTVGVKHTQDTGDEEVNKIDIELQLLGLNLKNSL